MLVWKLQDTEYALDYCYHLVIPHTLTEAIN